MISTTHKPATETTLILKKKFQASRERVFEAWTQPEKLKQWFAPSDEFDVPVAEVDARVGGRYRIVMRHLGKGIQHVVIGEYKEVKSPERLVFTWAWEGENGGDMLVTAEFRADGDSTEVMLKHEYLPTVESREQHKKGWEGCLARLPKVFAKHNS